MSRALQATPIIEFVCSACDEHISLFIYLEITYDWRVSVCAFDMCHASARCLNGFLSKLVRCSFIIMRLIELMCVCAVLCVCKCSFFSLRASLLLNLL